MTYEQALAYWFGRVNFEQRTPQASDLKLDRMRAFLGLLGNPQDRLRIIHVAGSKGKGSTSAMLEAILRQAGYRTGLFTSPHLAQVEERIQVDGRNISPDELTALLDDIRAVLEGQRPTVTSPLATAPTFFEIATALGFLHFARRRVEAAVVEVGLGGRFDSTNVCRPVLSVITSISIDHTQQLGNELASIAMEKAGIVKPGRPTISGATAAEARTVIERICRDRGSRLHELARDFHYRHEPGQVASRGMSLPRIQVRARGRTWPWMELGLLGEHQAANAAVVLACVEQLRQFGWHIPEAAAAEGLRQVRWPARLEVIGRQPVVLLDCAHNIASAEALVETLITSFPPVRRRLVFAVSGDKDVPGILRSLAPHFHHAYLTRYGSARSLPGAELADIWRTVSPHPCLVCETPFEAWQAARSAAGPEELICVTGSVFLAGELRPHLLRFQA